jgi:E3 ubiquitin-protein ligase HUWE1
MVSVAAFDVQVPHARRVLLRHLLRTIAIGSYAPSGNIAATRPQDADANLLYQSLRAMYLNPEEYGGSLFSLAVSVMTDLIHHEPQCYRHLEEAGLPEAFLKSVEKGVIPSGEAVVAIPNALVALCLNQSGLERVRNSCIMKVGAKMYFFQMFADICKVLQILQLLPTLAEFCELYFLQV